MKKFQPGLAAGIMFGGMAFLVLACVADAAGEFHARRLPTVDRIQPGELSAADFAGDEQSIADHLATVAVLANNVEDEDPETFGFITGDLWRVPRNKPYNARVQENVLTMGWFYSNERPWNPYFADEALRLRLEAAMMYLVQLQRPDGRLPEFPDDVPQTGNHKRAAASFGLNVGAHLIEALQTGPGIDPEVHAAYQDMLERVARWFLEETHDVWETGVAYSNQLVAGLVGIHILEFFGDPKLERLWHARLRYFADNAVSPAGFFYENGGVAHNYAFSVTTREMALLYEQTGSPLVKSLQERYLDWMSYNLVREPDDGGFFLNAAIDARHEGFNHFIRRPVGSNSLWTKSLPKLSAPYSPTAEEMAVAREEFRRSGWDGTRPLRRWVSPMPMIEVAYPENYPSRGTRDEAVAELPYLKSNDFTEFLKDGPREFVFARRPAYYVAMNFGDRDSSRQRMGLSFFWHPRMGMLIQSQNTDNLCWSTIYSGERGAAILDADGHLPARYWHGPDEIGEDEITGGGDFDITYRGREGIKRMRIREHRFERAVRVNGAFREQIPLVLQPDDQLSWIGGEAMSYGKEKLSATATGFEVRRGEDLFVIDWTERRPVGLAAVDGQSYLDGTRQLHLLSVTASDALTYTLKVRPADGG